MSFEGGFKNSSRSVPEEELPADVVEAISQSESISELETVQARMRQRLNLLKLPPSVTYMPPSFIEEDPEALGESADDFGDTVRRLRGEE